MPGVRLMLLMRLCCIAKRAFWQRQCSAIGCDKKCTCFHWPHSCLVQLLICSPVCRYYWAITFLMHWFAACLLNSSDKVKAWKPGRHGGKCSAQQFVTNHGVHVRLPAKSLLHCANTAIATETTSNLSPAAACAWPSGQDSPSSQ